MSEEVRRDYMVRLARFSDYRGILEIGDVYAGLDYVLSSFNRYLEDPNVFQFVAERGGEIVSVQS